MSIQKGSVVNFAVATSAIEIVTSRAKVTGCADDWSSGKKVHKRVVSQFYVGKNNAKCSGGGYKLKSPGQNLNYFYAKTYSSN